MTAVLALTLSALLSAQTVVTTTTTAPNAPPPTGPAAPAAPALPETGTAIVMGRVVDMGSGRPVAGAIVTLGGMGVMASVTNFNGGPTITNTSPGRLNGQPGASSLRVLTDSDGRFVFLDLPKGNVSFAVNATGYVGGGYGQRRPGGSSQPLTLEDGQRIGDVTLPVWKYAAISGTVTDEVGEPVVNMPVRLLQRTILGGKRLLKVATQAGTTDDRGIYRIGLLVPGDYVVAVAIAQATAPFAVVDQVQGQQFNGNPSALNTQLSSAGAPTSMPGTANAQQVGGLVQRVSSGLESKVIAGRTLAYQTAFFPAARTISEATVVSVASGDERMGVDVQLRLSSTVRVSGTVMAPDGPAANLALKLVPAGLDDLAAESGFETSATFSDASGAFTFLGVAPGAYLLRATKVPPVVDRSTRTTTTIDTPGGRSSSVTTSFGSGPTTTPTEPTLSANLAVAVGESDVTNVSVVLRAGPRINGRVEFEGAKERPGSDALKNIVASADPSDARALSGAAAVRGQFDANGQVFTTNALPGRYLLRASGAPTGWTFKAALHEGRDVSLTPLEIQSGDINDVVFVFTDHTNEISGSVRNATGAADADATVLLFPANEQAWIENGTAPRNMKAARTTKTGTFTLTSVPIGDYYVAAVRDEVVGDWPEPKFLLSLRSSATRITVNDGDKKTQDLRTIK